jgi:hypothetical protein
LGFLVVSSNLSGYGVSTFSVLQIRYLTAGIWLLGPPVVYSFITYTSRRFEDRAAPAVTGQFNWRRFAISSLLTAIPLALFYALLIVIPNVWHGLTWGVGLRLFLFYSAIVICTQMLWWSWRADPKRETWLINRSSAPFYAALLLTIVISYAVWFSGRIYPLIPLSLGGGRPLTVVFIEGERKMPDEIKKTDPAAKRSIPYKLLLSTDKYYVVVAPSPKERSIEVSRDAVAGIVVLE